MLDRKIVQIDEVDFNILLEGPDYYTSDVRRLSDVFKGATVGLSIPLVYALFFVGPGVEPLLFSITMITFMTSGFAFIFFSMYLAKYGGPLDSYIYCKNRIQDEFDGYSEFDPSMSSPPESVKPILRLVTMKDESSPDDVS